VTDIVFVQLAKVVEPVADVVKPVEQCVHGVLPVLEY
jgi:hypothetical protein